MLVSGEIISVILFFIGFYGLITKASIIKSIISIAVIETAAILFLLSIAFGEGGSPPLGQGLLSEAVADPLPQAFVITAIVLGIVGSAVNLTMLVSFFGQYKATNWNQIKTSELE
jgi:multicomponent Na+:H+ antiporter subunit C